MALKKVALEIGMGTDIRGGDYTKAVYPQLRAAGCDVLFTPTVGEMYPQGLDAQTIVSVPGVSERHCGASRPGHFDGVLILGVLDGGVAVAVAAARHGGARAFAWTARTAADVQCSPQRRLAGVTAQDPGLSR